MLLRTPKRVSIAVLVLLSGCAPGEEASSLASSVPPSPDERIAYFEEKLREDPAHWPALAHLGAAHLDRARESHDPAEVARAREILDRSLAIQPNLEALRARAALECFCHRFEDAVEWIDRAAAAAEDPNEFVALRVEAYLGLGRDADAEEALREAARGPATFHLLAARAQWSVAVGRTEQARADLERAAEVAAEADATDLRVWALVRTAGVLLDAGHSDEAEPYLVRAAELSPDDVFLGVHRAELLEARGRAADALSLYEDLLTRRTDPTLHARAYSLCRALGREDDAERHFAEAERGLRAVLSGGEVYTLAALARLYLDAGRNLEEAAELAERNLDYERDAASLELADRARSMTGGAH